MKRTTVAALALVAIAIPAVAQQMKLEDQVKYRRAAYNVIALNFGSLGAMAQDKKPFNQEEAVRNADIVAILATTPKGFFAEGTRTPRPSPRSGPSAPTSMTRWRR
jgi:cytochrome c556